MSSSDKYILVTESQNSEEGVTQVETNTKKEESASAALRALENQGIFLEKDTEISVHIEPRDELSRELLDQSGIEIVSSEG